MWSLTDLMGGGVSQGLKEEASQCATGEGKQEAANGSAADGTF